MCSKEFVTVREGAQSLNMLMRPVGCSDENMPTLSLLVSIFRLVPWLVSGLVSWLVSWLVSSLLLVTHLVSRLVSPLVSQLVFCLVSVSHSIS